MAGRTWIAACALGTAVVLGACTKSTTTTGASPQTAPAKPGPVTYTAHDFSFEGPATLPAGTKEITLENAGAQKHQLVFVRLDKNQDWTAQDAIDYINENPNAEPKWAVVVGATQPIKPNDSVPVGFGDFTGKPKIDPNASLEPGSYLVMCFVGDPQTKQSHAELGMVEKVTVA